MAATAVRLVFLPSLGTRVSFITCYPAVMLAALYGGLGPGLLATVFSALLADYFWIKPAGQLLHRDFDDWMSLATFVLSCIAISWITEAMYRAQSRALKAETQAQLAAERERAAEALREERDFTAAVLDTAGALVVVLDPKGRIKRFNRACESLTGYREAEVLGRIFWEFLIPPEDLPGVRETWHRLRAGGFPNTHENHWLAKDGSRRLIAWANTAIVRPTDEIEYIIATGLDITERMRLESELRQRNEELAIAAQRKDEFLAMLGHELRNPLAPIRNAVHLLRLIGPAEPRLEQARDLIDRQVTHMVRLVDDLLDVSRITRGKISLRKERVDLTAVVQQAVEAARPLITRKRQALTVSCAPEPIEVEADPARLVQVLLNLLNNAAKFTEPGGSITLSTERSGADARGVAAVIRVRDTGAGIAPELLPRIFDLFVQGETSLDRTEGGLGIGLTLVRHLVEQHGGRIETHSAGRGCGSEFVVTWPAAPTPTAVTAGTAAVDSTEPRRRLRILVVEDNVDAAESFVLLLQLQGHEIRAAHTGPAALEVAASFVPDVAFIDLGLPDLDGYEVARRLRALPAFRPAVLVALSGYGQEEHKRRAQAAGFDHHLTKPVDPSAIDRLLIDIGALC